MSYRICCIGAGYVGGSSMIIMADSCPGLQINVVDHDKQRIDSWNNLIAKDLPIYEPGLDEIHKRVLGKSLFFSTDVELYIKNADMVLITVNTPTKVNGHGAGEAADLTNIELAARTIAEFARGTTIVVERSTIPVRTADVLKGIFRKNSSENIHILSNPEFMAEGSAVQDLIAPDRVLIGGDDQRAIDELAGIYQHWVPSERILRTNLWSAELAKLTANAFLAQRISSVNTIAALCESSGAHIEEVVQAIGADHRIGHNFLRAGPGFGGSCFRKDLLNLVYLCHYFGLPDVANYWRSVLTINDWSRARISELIIKKLFSTLCGKKIVILGFAFKPHTNDIRESPAINICQDFLDEGAMLSIHDPMATIESIHQALSWQSPSSVTFNQDLMSSFREADAAVLLTEWPIYLKLDWKLLSSYMRSPAWFFDTRNVLNRAELENYGLNLWSIGFGGIQ